MDVRARATRRHMSSEPANGTTSSAADHEDRASFSTSRASTTHPACRSTTRTTPSAADRAPIRSRIRFIRSELWCGSSHRVSSHQVQPASAHAAGITAGVSPWAITSNPAMAPCSISHRRMPERPPASPPGRRGCTGDDAVARRAARIFTRAAARPVPPGSMTPARISESLTDADRFIERDRGRRGDVQRLDVVRRSGSSPPRRSARRPRPEAPRARRRGRT